jgi:2-succinyl-6-hydroxy-2,4-cyclohexadiene-1-carboxylate synthase
MTAQWPHLTWGNPHHPPLLMLHGFLGSSYDWHGIAKKLSHNYFCIAPDLPGHGEHTHRALDETLNLTRAASELIVWLKAENWTPLIGLGYSLGGRVLLNVAVHNPAQFHALILEGTNPGIDHLDERAARLKWDQANAKKLLLNGIQLFIDDWYDLEIFKSLHRDPDFLSRTKASRLENDSDWMAKLVVDFSPGNNPSLWDQLDRLTMPTLVLAGELDAKYRLLSQEIIKKLTGEIQLIEDAGHNTHLEKPEEFLSVIDTFLSEFH